MIVHIGFPKCASTALQTTLANCKDIVFLGCNPKNKPDEFYDKNIGTFLEAPLRFGAQNLFEEGAGAVQDYLHQLDKKHDGRVVLSYENLCFRLTPWDLPTDIKISRLAKILPDNSHLLIFHRPVREFLISLYKNYLNIGYTGTISAFLAELETLGNYGWLNDLDLGALMQNLKAAFPNMIPHFTDLTKPHAIEDIFETLKISIPPIPRENQSIKDSQISALLQFNRQQSPRKKLMDWLEIHRAFPNAPLEESEHFHLSRYRHAQTEFLKQNAPQIEAGDYGVFERTKINWPARIMEIEKDNEAFLHAQEIITT